MWLRIRVIAAFLICIAIPLTMGMGAVVLGTQYFLQDDANQRLQAATSSVLAAIEERAAQNLSHLKAWSNLPLMQDALIGDNGGDIARTLGDLKARYADFSSLAVTDSRGMVIASTEKSDRGASLATDEGFHTASSGSTFQSGFGFRRTDAPETIWFTVPLMASYDQQTVIGTLTGVLDFGALAKSVLSSSALATLGAKETHTLVLARRNDKHVVFASRTDARMLQALQTIDDRTSAAGVELTWSDKPFHVASAGLKPRSGALDLVLLARGIVPVSSTTAVADNLTNAFAAAAGAGLLIALFLAWTWSNPLVHVAGAMNRLGQGDVSWRIPPMLPHHAFADMARSLEVFRQTKIVRDRVVAREQALQVSKDDAATAALAKSEHLASLSRELRTQLNAIVGLSELINREALAAAGNLEHAGYAKDIARCGVQLLAVINDLFDLSEAEAGHLALNESQVDLTELVRESVDLMGDAARMAKVSLAAQGCDEPLAVRADGQKLKQVLFNLLSNAIKFTSEDGHVSVYVKISSDGRPTIIVQDNGIGMPTNLSPIALTPFSVGDDALNHGRHGAGLGLPLVRQLVDLHQGSVEIESEIGKGTTVTVALPASRLVVETDEAAQRLSA
ncbi:MAG: HAMP domain-containing histidine kinase [Alphaproteobacteria bacterium]|nr:HAMP domain-containing histidine kinase [Alphaproteobacteria bacterium]